MTDKEKKPTHCQLCGQFDYEILEVFAHLLIPRQIIWVCVDCSEVLNKGAEKVHFFTQKIFRRMAIKLMLKHRRNFMKDTLRELEFEIRPFYKSRIVRGLIKIIRRHPKGTTN